MSTATATPPTAPRSSGSAVRPAIIDAVKESLEKTYASYFSEKPKVLPEDQRHPDGPCIAGIISFLGDESFSLAWIFSKETAPVLAKRFAGFDIPFESTDMGDIAGELVNVIAGEIRLQLERKQIKTMMSLPTVARGSPLELVPATGPTIARIDYSSTEGPFSFRLAAATGVSRIPGR